MQYAFSFVMRGEQKMEGEKFSFEMPHFAVMADETPKTCIVHSHKHTMSSSFPRADN